MKRNLFPLIIVLLLTACGFHLRGMVDIPKWLNNVSIISNDDDNQIAALLASQLDGYKIKVNPDPSDADYWLTINSVKINQQIVSIGASTNPRQYQLNLTVNFMLQTRKGQLVRARRSVVVSRQLTINNDRILGSNEEETILIEEMKQEAVTQIINRLSRK
ncbi:MAG: LPS assembly lipoprotein LptE [bacterium]|nr:LPS assembly lipoprotein LptE [bacterium]